MRDDQRLRLWIPLRRVAVIQCDMNCSVRSLSNPSLDKLPPEPKGWHSWLVIVCN